MSSIASYPAQADAASNTDPVSVTVPDETPSAPVMHTLRTMGYNAQRIRCKSYATHHAKYNILSYDPQWICQDDVETGLYRSVVVDPETNRVLAYSPPYSMDVNRFAVKHPQTNLARYVATEAVEGTMINLFYDWRIQKWEIATKNAIGGKYFFFRTQYPVDDASVAAANSPATFLDMFLDNFNHMSPWKAEDGTSIARDLDDIWWLPILDTQYTYSFVLQHPKNHIVYPVDKPKLYLVAVYEILQGVNEAETAIHTVRMVPYEEYSQYKVIREMILTGCIHYPPAILTRSTVDAYRAQHCEPERPADKMGVMIWDTVTGDRIHLENRAYLALKELRGNNPNLQYHYYSLYRMNKVREFLLAFPMYKQSFYRFYTQYHTMITKVHEGYLSYYVRKEGIPIDKNVFVHVSRIHHEIYLKSLAEGNKKVITHKVVRAYFDAKEPRELLSI